MSLIAVVVVAALLIPHWSAWMFSLPMVCALYIDLMGVLQVCFIAIMFAGWTKRKICGRLSMFIPFLPIVGGNPCQVSFRDVLQ